MGTQSQGRAGSPSFRKLMQRSGNGREAVRRAVSLCVESLESRWLFAAVTTDKPDYNFGETALISGSEFAAGETVQLQVTHADGTPGSNDNPQNQAWQVQADAGGNIAATWLVNDPDATGATYILTATGLTSGDVATATFTDSRTINSVTLNGGTSVTVAPGASISANVDVTTDNGNGNLNWRSTGWRIATTPPGTLTVVDHANHDGAGTYSETFSITAPTTPGTYNAYFIAYSDDGGSNQPSVTFVLAGAVVVNGPPVITLPGGPLTYTENAAPTIIDAGATATDTDSSNFATGTLTVDYTANGSVDDRLAIRNQGTGAGQIGVSGANVTFGGTTIGTFTGGTGTTPLVVTFNASSSPAAAQALMRNITFANVSDNPSTAARTVRFVLTDGDGGTSNAATKTINVTAVNDAPSVAADNATVAVDEGQTATNTGTYSDVDSAAVTISASVGTITKTGTSSGTWSWSLGTTDGPNQSQTVTITANDGNGGITTTTFGLTVNNVAPTIAITGAATVNEGSSYSLTLGAVTDPGADTVTSYVVHWGDGNSDTYASNGAKSHTYADGPNTRSITVDLVDEDGTHLNRANALSVNVNNVAPTIAISGDASVDEGSAYSLTLGAVADPGADTVSSYVVHWGDGNTTTYASNGAKSHTYADGPNSYNITLDLVDEDGTYLDRANALSVTVKNVAPVVTAPANQAANEGQNKSFSLGSFTDPAGVSDQPYVVNVSWGDGSTDTAFNLAAPGSLGSKNHIYADNGAYTVTVTVTEDGGTGAAGSNTFAANIANVAPTIAISGAASVNEGSAYSLTLGAVTDPGTDTVSSYIVHWGDGNSDTYTSNGAKSHTYADGPNAYDVTVDLVDEDGTHLDTANDLSVTVNNVAPTIPISGAASVNEGSAYSLTLGAVTEPGADTVSSYVVHWGDGNSSTYASNGAKTHTYADGPNPYNITVDLVDEDGTYLDRANAKSITVNNVAPTVAISGATNVDEGSSYSLTLGAVTDPGADTVSSYVVHWGDGASDTYAANGVKTHTYADGTNNYNITVDLTDEDGTFLDRANAQAVTVDNVAPSISISGGAPSVSEGSAFSLTLGAVADPGTDTVTSYIVHWGDGNNSSYSTSTGVKTHIYADGPNTYGITVDLVDEDGTHFDRANPLGVTVDNIAPTIAVSGAASVNEGSSYSLTLGAVTDPGQDTVTNYIVHWGDGSTDSYGANGVKTHTYADGPNNYDITVDLKDEDGTFLNRGDALNVTVNNVAPTIAISGAASVNEGSAYSLTLGAVTDPGQDTVTSYIVHWGDGNSDTYGSAGAKTHTYADGPNAYNITVDLTDEDGTFLDAANAKSVTVNNVAPTIAISGAASVNEGSSYSLTLGAVTDPGNDTVASYIVHWGDGSSDAYPTNGAKTHTYADGPNSYNITVDLTDEDGTHLDAANALGVTVNNVPPSIAISGGAPSVSEGSAYSLTLGAVTDPGTDTVTSYIVHWGDGNSDTYAGNGLKTHIYADGPSTYGITVDLVDEDGTHLDRANPLGVTVDNVAPSIAISGAASVNEGSAYSLTLGAVTDPGTDTVTSYIVHWGDGNSDTYGTAGAKNHAYADGPNSYNITVDLVDEDGTFLNRGNTLGVTVNNVAPTIAISGAANVDEGSSYSLTLGAVTDPGTDTVSSYVVHWGDGASDTFTTDGVKTHAYADGPNNYNITVDLTDEDGTFLDRANAQAVTVANVAPGIAISGAANTNEGSSYSLTLGAVTDPGTDTVSSYIVHWGDGSSDTYGSNGAKSHTYADGLNNYNVTVDLVDEDGTHLDTANALGVTVKNVAPMIAITGAASANEGSAYTLNLGAVTDPGTDTVSSYLVHWGDGSTSTYASNGSVTHSYADGPNSYNITVDLTDEDGTFVDRANAQSVTVNNVAPTIAISGAASVNEGSAYSLTLGAVTDPGTDTVGSYIVHWGDGSSDTYAVNGVKTHTYADGPNAYNITVDLTDEDGTFLDRANALSVTVNNVNPNATANAYTLNEDGSKTGNVITDNTGSGADSDPAGANDPLAVTAVNGSSAGVGVAVATTHGTVTVNANGTFSYAPAANYFGADSFTYTISDGDGGTSTATVSFTINEVNDAPDAVNDAGSTAQDTSYSGNVLANDTDPDNTDGVTGNEDTLIVTGHSTPAHGTLTIGANGAYTYTPNLGYSGTDSFTYTISDGRGGTDTASVNINVGAAAANSIYLRNDDCFGGQMLIVNGSAGADDISINTVSGGGVQVNINGTLKGTYYPTGRIVVFGYAGNDQITLAGSVPNPAWLYGDAGDDMLNLGNGGGIVWGGDGSDHINGGSGADILIGGQGGDRIVGNPGDDILCAGYTKYDNRFSSTYAHEDAWCNLYHEWARTDLATTSVPGDSSYTSFEQRIDHLTGAKPGGHNGSYVLNNTTVDDDDDYDQIDMLTGSSGDDWFLWTKGEDKVNGISAAEGLEDLDTIS